MSATTTTRALGYLLIAAAAAATTADDSSSNAVPTPQPPAIEQLLTSSLYTPFIVRATSSLIAATYVPVSSTLRITHASTGSDEARLRQRGFIDEVIRNTSASIAITIESPVYITPYRPRYYNVFFVDGYPAFRLVYQRMSGRTFDFTGQYAIVLSESSRYQYDTILRILQDCWSLEIVNVVVLVSIHPRAQTAVYTYFPFTQFHCEAVAPVILNYYVTGGFMYNSPFFPRKTRNLWGCPLRLALYVLIPFMLLRKLPEDDPRGYAMDGIDGITTRVLSQRLNFTPIVQVAAEGRGQIFKNGSSTGAFGMVLGGQANLTIGAIGFTVDRAAVLTPSSPYYQSPVHFAVPKGRNYTAFETLFMPFDTAVWSGTGGLFVLTLALFVLLRKAGGGRMEFVVGGGNRTPFVNMMAVYMGAVLTDAIPMRNFARFLLMVWTLGCLVLRSAYQGALFQHLQTQRMVAPVEKLDDLMAANYSLKMNRPLFFLFENMPKVKPYLSALQSEDNMRDFDHLVTHPQEHNVYLTPKLAAGYYNSIHMNRTVLLSRERLFIVPVVIYFRKHSCLARAVNKQIIYFQVAGLIEQWLRNFYDEGLMRKDAEQQRGEHRALHLGQVSGAFQICAYMLVLAMLVLLAEMMAPHNERVRAVLEAL